MYESHEDIEASGAIAQGRVLSTPREREEIFSPAHYSRPDM